MRDRWSPTAKVVWIPVTTGGRVGGVTIFADTAQHRWLVRCDGLAPNQPDQAYQIWFITEQGEECRSDADRAPGGLSGA